MFLRDTTSAKKAKEKLEVIANIHGYDIKMYEIDPSLLILYQAVPPIVRDSVKLLVSTTFNGINFIKNGNTIFTGSINPEEKSYLQSHGLEAIVVPLPSGIGKGAGLRCIYGEFDT